VRFEVEKPLKEQVQYRFAGKEPESETEFEFKGNGNDWSFINFDKLPENVVLKVKGKPDGYEDNETLKPEQFYPFKRLLPIVLEIKGGAQMPVEIAFWYGRPNTTLQVQLLKNPEWKTTEAREFANHNPLDPYTERQSVKFFWDTTATPVASPTPQFTSPASSPTPEPSWITFLTEESPEAGLLVLLILLIVLVLFCVFVLPALIQRIKRSPKGRHKPTKGSAPVKPLSNYNVTPTVLDTATSAQMSDDTRHTSLSNRKVYRDDDPTLSGKKQSTKTFITSPMQADSLGNQDAKKLLELEKKMEVIEEQLAQKINRNEELSVAAKQQVDNILNARERKLSDAINTVENLLNDENARSKNVEQELRGEIVSNLASSDRRIEQNLSKFVEHFIQEQKRLEERLDQLQVMLSQPSVLESFYARTLGAVLGKNVEDLQDGKFEQLIGERLNQFFQTEVPRGESLQELRTRAEGVSDALKGVADQMSKLNAAATDEAQPHLQRARSLVAELSGLHAQLQSRRLTIETTMHIPVSAHPGARQTFTDELGRGLRREIDKLSDPQSYFEGDLKRLITSDVIAIVDICDKKVAPPPGAHPELETALKQMFEQAGLRDIVPRQGEPFRAAEQDLVQMVQGEAGRSLTVAEVITRGFYYKDGDNETLLRKAGVTVYR
jgi:ElaB/YqjD/DUF883 family membrane-anchored ribosome-binding protein